jgi:hypothetical protein
MTTRFYGVNKIYNATLTPSSQNFQFPVSNIKDDRSTKLFRTNTNADTLVIDLGSAVAIDAFCLVGSSITGLGISALTVEMNSSNSWTTPAVTQAITLDSEFNWGSYEWASPQTYRYVRLILTSTLGYCELSNIFIGGVLTPANQDFSYPLTYRENDLSKISENRYGQKFVDNICKQRELSGKMENLYPSELEYMLNWIDTLSVTKPLFLKLDSSSIFSDANRANGRYYLKSIPKMTYELGNLWSLSFDFEEAL